LLLYWEIAPVFLPYLRGSTSVDAKLTPAERTLAKWFAGNDDYKNERLKLIPFVAEGPWVVRNMVTGRPAIIGKKLPVTYRYTPPSHGHCDVLECTLDIGSSSNTAKRIVSVCRRYMSALTVDIGFVIQGDCAAELPEQMMGAVRIYGVDPIKAAQLN
jgi:Protein ENHANCED DISEASE RESISTANCE 2, C-terminal